VSADRHADISKFPRLRQPPCGYSGENRVSQTGTEGDTPRSERPCTRHWPRRRRSAAAGTRSAGPLRCGLDSG